MKAVVLAAGKGTRMREVSLELPKILLPLGQGTVGDNLLRGLKEGGASELLIIVGYMEEQVEEHFGDGSALGVRIDYLEQEEPLGTGHAAGLARDFVGEEESFVLAYGDIATPLENCAGLVADFGKHSPEASLSVYRVKDPSKGAAVYVENGYMKSLVEKPPRGSSTTHFDNAGVYVFNPRVFEMLDRIDLSPRGEYELTDAVTFLVESGRKVRAYEFQGFWSNVTSPEDLLEVNKLVIDRLSEDERMRAGRFARGREVSHSALVHQGAKLGRCSIGPYTVVARGARVTDGAKVSHAIICRNAVVGEGAFLDHVFLGPGCMVEAGARHVGAKDRVLILPEEG